MRKKIVVGLIVLIAFVWTVGCKSAISTPTAVPTMLQYIGHSCTLITASDGTRIISDPYGTSYPSGLTAFPADLSADAVTVSHFHPDHANNSVIQGTPKVMIDPGVYQVGMVKITGYKGDHGLVNGRSSGENTVFVFEIGEVKIVHLGGAGVVTQSDILAAMEEADVTILDIMGDAAHPLVDELNQLLELKARTIIPTHYSFEENPRYYGSATMAEFLRVVPSDLTVVKQGSTVKITPNMPEQLVILAPAVNENQ